MDNTPQGLLQAQQQINMGGHDNNFMKWFLDTKREIKILKYMWMGWEEDEKGFWIQPKDQMAKRIMNEKGIHWAVSLMEGYLGKTYQTSSFNEEHMNYIMRGVVRSTWFGISMQYREFDLSKVNVYVVSKQIISQVHSILLSARANGIKDFLTKTHSVSEIRQLGGDERRGFFSGITSLFGKSNSTYPGGQQ